MLSNEIQFTTTCKQLQVVAYLKEKTYDVYMSGICIQINASFQWVMAFKTIMTHDI